MPYEVHGNCVHKQGEAKPIPGGCHDNPKEAYAQIAAIERSEGGKALWTSAQVNELPDSSFLYVAPGGKKDDSGKTVPRSLRYFPVKDGAGRVDLPHLRNAIARIPQADIPANLKPALQNRARAILTNMNKGQ